MSNPTTNTQTTLKSAIIYNPLVVTADTTLTEVITQMISGSTSIDNDIDNSCVLVIEDEKIVGIVTERDVVKLSVQNRSLNTLKVREVMVSPVLTLQESEFTDLSSIMRIFKQHRIRHLPILDQDAQLLGLITYESLLQIANPINFSIEHHEWDFKQSEQRFISLTTFAPVGIFCTDIEGNCLYVNDHWCQIAGLTTSEALGWGWINAIHFRDRSLVTASWKAFVQEFSPFSLEYRFQNASGLITWVYGQAVAEYDNTDKIIGYVGAITNISDRKSAEATLQESEERLRLALRAANQGLYDLNIQTGETIVSPEYATILGYDPNTFQETNAKWIERLHPDDQEIVANTYKDYVAGNLSEYKVEFRQRTQSGEWKWLLSLGKILEWDKLGNPRRMLGTHTDISDRKHTETALAQLAAIVESSTDAIISKTLEGIIISWNAGAERLFGYTAKEAIGQSIALIIPIDRWDEEVYILGKIKHGEPISYYETIRQHKDGKIIDISLTVSPIRAGSGKIIGASKIARDIGELKQAKARLLQLNQELEAKVTERTQELWQVNSMQRAILDSADYSFISTDPLGLIQSFNPTAVRMLGYSPSEVISKITPAIFHDRQEVIDRAATLSKELEQDIPVGFDVFVAKSRLGIVSEEEWTYIRKDGSRFPVLLSVTAMRDVNHQIIGFLGIAKDISDRKQMETRMKRYENIISSTKDGIALLDRNYNYQIANQAYLSWCNKTSDQVIGASVRDILGSELFDTFIKPRLDRGLGGETVQYEQWFDYPNIVPQFLSVTYTPYLDLNQTIAGIIVSLRNITNLKQAEQAIAKYAREVEDLYNNAPCGYHSLDAEGRIIKINDTELQWLGYEREEILGKYLGDLLPLESLLIFQTNFSEFKRRGWVNNLELNLVCKNGTIFPVFVSATAITDNEGNYLSSRSTLFDARDRKRSEEALQESVAHQRALISAIPDLIMRVNQAGIYLEFIANPMFPLVGNISDMTGRHVSEVLSSDLAQKRIEYIQLALETDSIQSYEQRLSIDGNILEEEVRIVPYSKEEVLVLVGNITDRKTAEMQLQQQIVQQRLIERIFHHIRSSLDLKEVLNITVEEIHTLLLSDRVLVYQIFDNGTGATVAESVLPNFEAILDNIYPEEVFPKEIQDAYLHGRVYRLNDRETESVLPCLVEFLREIEVRAKLVVPIIQHEKLWGLLIVHQCDHPRQWQNWEIELLQQLASQFEIAIQQASLYQQLQLELRERQQAEQLVRLQADRETLLREIMQRIRQSLNLHDIFKIATLEIRQFLQADRVGIYMFDPDSNYNDGAFVAESVVADFASVIAIKFHDDCFGEKYAAYYSDGRFYAVADIYDDGLRQCHIELLSAFQIRANLVVPLHNGNNLWGLLCIHQCSSPRHWKIFEIRLVQQISNQLSIAIQQAKLYQQVQIELANKEQLYQQLNSELEQKKVLIQEVHHRVKNNLQVMSSLLSMQFRNTTPELKIMIEDYQNRIQSMALIHAQLYQNEDLANINFHDYISDLTTNLFQCYGSNSTNVQYKLEVSNIFISLDQAIPLGLIINELISNALKYAFPEGFGEINIRLIQVENQFHLTVSDNGIGIPPELDLKNTRSLGMQLVNSLANQLEGKLTYEGHEGLKFQLTFEIL